MCALKSDFLLDPEVTFLNHGSFGATPKFVFEVNRAWQLRMERQPVHFLVNELPQFLAEARGILGNHINAEAQDVAFVPNATFALNVVARSLQLRAGDEVLASNHEYGACNHVWQYLSQKRGFRYIRQPISTPYKSQEAIVDQFWNGVSAKTKVVFISHITSPTATTFPVREICRRARESGILTIVDGAHTLGQIALDLKALDADFYMSNGHKWLCSPKGSAFLYAKREKQELIEPLVVSWGWGPNRELSYGSDFIDFHQWLGTTDPSATLSIPAAIEFQKKHNWTAVRRQCHALLCQTIERICALTDLPSIYPDDTYFHQMAVAPLPQIKELKAMKAQLIDEYRIEVPLIEWNGRHFIRVSIQGYNTQADVDALMAALAALLPQCAC